MGFTGRLAGAADDSRGLGESPIRWMGNHESVRTRGGNGTAYICGMNAKPAHPELPVEWHRWIVQSVRGYALFSTDLKTRVVTWDRGASDLFGYRREDVLGEDAKFIFTPTDIDQRAPEVEVAQAVANHTAPDERWHVRKDGSLFWANGLMMKLHDDAGRHVGFLKIIREATPP
jgi:PAS domain S-box-containing protein